MIKTSIPELPKVRVVSEGDPMTTHVYFGDVEIPVDYVKWEIESPKHLASLVVRIPISMIEADAVMDVPDDVVQALKVVKDFFHSDIPKKATIGNS